MGAESQVSPPDLPTPGGPLATAFQTVHFRSFIETDTYPAIVVHMGSMVGGHYIAYVLVDPERVFLAHGENVDVSGLSNLSLSDRPEKGQADRRVWCYCSDTEIRPASEAEVLNARAYLCFVSSPGARSGIPALDLNADSTHSMRGCTRHVSHDCNAISASRISPDNILNRLLLDDHLVCSSTLKRSDKA